MYEYVINLEKSEWGLAYATLLYGGQNHTRYKHKHEHCYTIKQTTMQIHKYYMGKTGNFIRKKSTVHLFEQFTLCTNHNLFNTNIVTVIIH